MGKAVLRPNDVAGSFKDLEAALANIDEANLTKNAVTTNKIKDAQVTLAKLSDEVRQQIMLDGW